MTTPQEFIMTLFNKDTIYNARKLFNSTTDNYIFDSYEMRFRLFKPTGSNINLELPVDFITSAGKEPFKMSFGSGHVEKRIKFGKPVGFYTKSNESNQFEIVVNILNEFKQDYEYLKNQGLLEPNIKTRLLSMAENAVIAAFSMEALDKALLYEDAKFQANGFKCEIFLTHEGYPQVFLDDVYNFPGPIAAYMLKEQKTINPMIEYKELFDKYFAMSLFTAFKRL